MRYEVIDWLDSGTFLGDEWTPIADLIEKSRHALEAVRTVGQVFHEDDNVVVVGLSYDATNDAVYGAQVIAKSAILSRRHVS